MRRKLVGGSVSLAAFGLIGLAASAARGADEVPRALDDRLHIRLFAQAPQIVTPTGIDVDRRGRVWVLESNTHFRPAGYKGHPSDRLLVMEDTNGDGTADHVRTFADGFTHAMSVAVRPGGDVYVATRKEVILLHDADGDGVPDRRAPILTLDTPGDYPHNGLAGLAFDGLGRLYVGLGENLGASYKLIGLDGATLRGGGEGGSLYRCLPNGTGLTRLTTGFWNPHASCVDAFGRVFTVDNDPDSRPPCRLLHIVPGGDYGYRYRNGRRGIHPFTAWDGELPGTLPMVAGTGEAPSGVVAYESDGLPADFIGNLLVTSWGDHRIDRFRLKPKGMSFTSVAEPIVAGGENFRPVGLAVAPDGSLFCSDWVSKEYHLHGQGRVWRISAVKPTPRELIDLDALPQRSPQELLSLLRSPRIDIRRATAQALAAQPAGVPHLRKALNDRDLPSRSRIEALWALAAKSVSMMVPQFGTVSSIDTNLTDEPGRWLPLAAPDDEVATAFVGLTGRVPSAEMRLAANDFVARLTHPQSRDPQYDLAALKPYLFAHLATEPRLVPSLLEVSDPFVFASMIRWIAVVFTPAEFEELFRGAARGPARARLGLLLAARRHDRNGMFGPLIQRALADPDPAVQRAAVQWVGEESLAEFQPRLEAIVRDGAVTSDLFEAVLASLDLLDGVKRVPKDEPSGADFILKLVRDEQQAPGVRARALRMLNAKQPGLDAAFLRSLIDAKDAALAAEGVQAAAWSALPQREELLRRIAGDEARPIGLRAEAVAGLAAVADQGELSPATIGTLTELLATGVGPLQIESLRLLRNEAGRNANVREALSRLAERSSERETSSPQNDAQQTAADQLALALAAGGLVVPQSVTTQLPQRPAEPAGWLVATASGGNADAGRRVYFNARGAACSRCHTIQGRGGEIGPDLSVIARSRDRRKLAESILLPSQEVAPQYVTWSIQTRSGKVHTGLIVSEERSGKVRLGTTDGTVVELPPEEIEQRQPQKISTMPDRLVDRLSVLELRDLLAFLETLK